MALGETVGSAWLTSVNSAPSDKRWRWLRLLGDPTLRLNRLKPPPSVDAWLYLDGVYKVNVSWAAAPGASKYYLYRATSAEAHFEYVGGPVTGSPFSGILDGDGTKRVYMVRAAALASTGRGSYWNLSQGTTKLAQ